MLFLLKNIELLINKLLIFSKNQQKIAAIKFINKKSNYSRNILINNYCLNSDWTSLSVICFGVCELSIRCSFVRLPFQIFDQD